MAPGTTTMICMNQGMVDARARDSADQGGDTDNITDLTNFLVENPGIWEQLELDEDSVDALMDNWGTTRETNEGFRMKYYCMDAMKLATTGVMAIATVALM